jgi:hypothetical protein
LCVRAKIRGRREKRREGEEEGGREKRREGEGRLNAKIVC